MPHASEVMTCPYWADLPIRGHDLPISGHDLPIRVMRLAKHNMMVTDVSQMHESVG